MKQLLTLIALGVCLGTPAHAALVGDSVDASLQGGSGFGVLTQFSPTSAVVGAGAEFNGAFNLYGTAVDVTLDFDNAGFTVTLLRATNGTLVDGGGINLSSVDWPNPPGGITGINPDAGNPDGISFSNLTSNAFQIKIGTLGGPLNLSAGQPSIHRFTFVPEPSSLALLSMGGLLLGRRRR